MSRFDADFVIVGGGPAGSSTALHLTRLWGVAPDRVHVVDKATFPRDKPCAGAISQLGVDALAAVGVPVDVPSVAMRGVRLLADGQVGETVAPVGVVVRRSELDARLLARAASGGVVVRDGDGLAAIERIDGGFRVVTASGRVTTTRYVAACDGAGSTTRKLLGIREAARKGHLYVLETAPRATGDEAMARGLVDFDLGVLADGLEGYYWDFPTVIGGARQVSRGIYHANLTPRSNVKAALARALSLRGIALADVRPRAFSTRPFVPGAPTWRARLVLVGEAAGIDQTTGEGIAQAIVMGAIAAKHLARALEDDRATFDDYGREVVTSTIGRHMLQSARLARVVYGRYGGPARRYLVGSDFARAVALRWYRGDSLGKLAKLRMAVSLAIA